MARSHSERAASSREHQARQQTRQQDELQRRRRFRHDEAPADNATSPIKGSDFLDKLPGEIRNRIYRMALIEDPDISVTKFRFEEPGLLKACKQVCINPSIGQRVGM